MRLGSALSALAIALLASFLPSASAQSPCEPWSMRTVAQGLGRIENLEPDGTGGMLIGVGERSAVERITPDGGRTTAVADIDNPGGLRAMARHFLRSAAGASSPASPITPTEPSRKSISRPGNESRTATA